MQNAVKFSESGRILTARLSGEIDHHVAKGQREEIDNMLFRARPETLRLDFSEVRFMDSSGIGLIRGRADVCEGIGCRIEVTGLSGSLKKLVRLSGIEKIKCLTVANG